MFDSTHAEMRKYFEFLISRIQGDICTLLYWSKYLEDQEAQVKLDEINEKLKELKLSR